MFRPIYILLLLTLSFCYSSSVFSQFKPDEVKRIKVALRQVGHELLLSTGDSTSRVLPVNNDSNVFTFGFERDLSFSPDSLVLSAQKNLNPLAQHYLIEVKTCEPFEVTYSFEINQNHNEDLLPCKSRAYPKFCYTIAITIFELTPEQSQKSASSVSVFYIILGIGIGFFLVYGFIRKKNTPNEPPAKSEDIHSLGNFQLDSKNMQLTLGANTQELTSKETDLLLYLLDRENQVVKRHDLLNAIWQDEGDYIGRTLDVFISKLRKKLSADPNLKIMNIRGVGYKLVVN